MGEPSLQAPAGPSLQAPAGPMTNAEAGTSSIEQIEGLLSEATSPALPGHDTPRDVRHTPLVTTRVGFVFIVIALTNLFCATAAMSVADRKFHAIMWIATIAASALGGMLAMRSGRTLRVIETELRRATGQPGRWKSVRPIIGSDSITEGWNELLQQVASGSGNDDAAKRSAAALDQEVITLARAMRGLPVSWVITDTDGRIRYLSPAACGLFGISDDADHAGRDVAELIGLRDEADESASRDLAELLSDVRMVHKRREMVVGPNKHHLRITRSRLDGRTGDGQGLAWILNDVTQQQKAVQSRDQFLMTATHELRTPLNNLHAYAEALQEEDDLEVERQKEFCNIIVSESHRLGRLVDQLLTVGQMEAGSMIANRHELELLPLVKYATDHVTAQAQQKGHQLLTDLSPKLPTVIGDRDKLQAALVNLLGNAVKYTQPGGEILVRCGVEDQQIRIDVQDNGPGISPEESEKVFEQFYRCEQAAQSDERGNGLGLAFAREVARIHGGELKLTSNPGEGSTFSMLLPIGGQSRSAL